MSHWQIIFSIGVSSLILTMLVGKIKGKMCKLPIEVFLLFVFQLAGLNPAITIRVGIPLTELAFH